MSGKLTKTILILQVFLLLTALQVLASEDDEYEYRRRGAGVSAKFYGVVEKKPGSGFEGIWIIGGRKVLVTGETRIEEEYGRLQEGAYVEVKGYYTDELFRAYKIEVKRGNGYKHSTRSKFYGKVQWRPEDRKEGIWVINDRAVRVTGATRIKEEYGRATRGAYVEVKGEPAGDVFIAHEIEVKQGR